MKDSYALITATWNEEKYIRHTIDAVLNQTILPSAWVIVSDGSTDGTDEIVKEAALRHDFIVYVRKERNQAQLGFASKVFAIRKGLQHLEGVDYSFLGHLDSDVSFAPQYYESVLSRFAENPKLGLAGGFIHELTGTGFRSRPSNSLRSAAGAIQLFRRKCYEEIGGLVPLSIGGEDWHAEIKARMKGWEVAAFPELKVLHHKQSIAARGILRENSRQGLLDYSFGTHPFFEIVKCVRRMKEKPFVLGALVRMSRFLWAYCRLEKRPVSDELVTYLRREQLGRLYAACFRHDDGQSDTYAGVSRRGQL
jgi:glycosyltransferase involved in cell wall biosynthesis